MVASGHYRGLCIGMLLLALVAGGPRTHAVPDLDTVMRGAEQLKQADPDELLNRALDKAAQREQAGQPHTAPAEQDAAKAYGQVTGKALDRAGRPNAGIFVIAVLGIALVLTMLSVRLIRFIAHRLAGAVNRADLGRSLTDADVRYSWYYRDAISRFPEPRKPRDR